MQRYQYSKLKYIYDKGGFTFQDEEDPYTVKFNNAEQQLIFHLGDTQIAKVDAENQKLTLIIMVAYKITVLICWLTHPEKHQNHLLSCGIRKIQSSQLVMKS